MMLIKQLLGICSLMLLFQNANAQQKIIATVAFDTTSKKNNEIVYQRSRPLLIEDFKGSYEQGSNAVAMAYSGVAVQYDGGSKNGTLFLNIKLLVSFNKTKSWCLDKAKNDYTLAHEQRHFDITALNACGLYQALKEFNFTKDFQNEIANLQQKFQQKNEEQQAVYDRETNHGINKTKQAEWHLLIAKELEKCTECYKQ